MGFVPEKAGKLIELEAAEASRLPIVIGGWTSFGRDRPPQKQPRPLGQTLAAFS
jgi:hypothetical protein